MRMQGSMPHAVMQAAVQLLLEASHDAWPACCIVVPAVLEIGPRKQK